MRPADLILFHAQVLTLNPRQPQAQAVAIGRGRILGVGGEGALEALVGPGTKRVNCQGRTLVPGFIDAHCHILAYAQSLLSLDLSPARSIAQLKKALRAEAALIPPGSWLTARGYNEFYLAERRHPTRWELDEASPQHPIRLIHRSGHAQVLNSLALSLVGINIETPEPPEGLIERDLETGEPNGLLFGMENYLRPRLPLLTERELDKAVALANASFISLGLTSLQDATASNDPAQWQLFRRLKEDGKLLSRLNLMAGTSAVEEFALAGLVTGSGARQLRLGAAKLTVEETTGRLSPQQEELNELARRAHRAGFQLAFHTLEAGTLLACLEAIEKAGVQPRHRPRLEHCSLCPQELLPRLTGLGAVIVTQPPFIFYSGERYLATIPPSQLPWLYRIGSFRKEGVAVAGSSDAPVVPPNPLVGIAAAIDRRAETGQRVSPQEAVSPLQALSLYTKNAAHAAFEEKEKGSIETGKLADLVLLSADPTQLPPDEIRELKVVMTIIGGKIVYEEGRG